MRRFAVGVLVLSALVLAPIRPAGAASIQPGDRMWSSVGGCTLGFVVDSSAATYFMTAAHCVDHLDELIELEDGTKVGAVAAVGDAGDVEKDWALIRVAPELVGQVSGVVRGHAAPTGVADSNDTAFGDVVDYSGWGIPWYVHPTLREGRFGLLTGHDPNTWVSAGPDTFGDSGGPVLHRRSGGAVGLVSQLCVGLCSSMGPSIEGILPQIAAKGLNVTLRTGGSGE